MTQTPDYVHKDNPERLESERLQKFEEIFDPRTKVLLKIIGLREGISFLEAGLGRGGLLPWLLETVGLQGNVVSIDMNPRFIDPIKRPNFLAQQGDWARIDLGNEQFDLIHERFVLTHIANPGEVLKKMVAALKPGGWILLEDSDFSAAQLNTKDAGLSGAFNGTLRARNKLFSQKNIDFSFGSHLPGLLSQSGFTNIQEDVYSPLDKGGSGLAEIMRLSTLQLWDQYLQTGVVSAVELQAFVELAGNPDQAAIYFSTVSAWGQKPRSHLLSKCQLIPRAFPQG
jgi:SAM-dependent methyltransferase